MYFLVVYEYRLGKAHCPFLWLVIGILLCGLVVHFCSAACTLQHTAIFILSAKSVADEVETMSLCLMF